MPDLATTAIQVTASMVVLDLGGFMISGPNACNFAAGTCPLGLGFGINQTAAEGELTVRNGLVKGIGGPGIAVNRGGIVEDVVVTHCGGVGIAAAHAVVRNNVLRFNSAGIACGPCLATGNVVTNSMHNGINTGFASHVVANTVYENKGFGLAGSFQPTYSQNRFDSNVLGDVQAGAVNLGHNFCTAALCP